MRSFLWGHVLVTVTVVVCLKSLKAVQKDDAMLPEVGCCNDDFLFQFRGVTFVSRIRFRFNQCRDRLDEYITADL